MILTRQNYRSHRDISIRAREDKNWYRRTVTGYREYLIGTTINNQLSEVEPVMSYVYDRLEHDVRTFREAYQTRFLFPRKDLEPKEPLLYGLKSCMVPHFSHFVKPGSIL